MTFRVPGLPKPQPRPRFNSKTGRVYTPDTARRWREAVAWCALGAKNQWGKREPITGPVELRLHFTLPDNRKCDLSNLIKGTEDALVEAGVMKDDHQVVAVHATKRIGPDTGCSIDVVEATWIAERARRNG